MTNSTDTTAEWYVLRVTYQRELSTKEYLDKLNIENFVPIRVVRRRNSKGQFSGLAKPPCTTIFSSVRRAGSSTS